MKTFARTSFAVLTLLLLARLQPAAAQDNAKPSLERGRYIVEHVAKCGRCHTPHNVAGEDEHDRANWLMGGPLQIQPTYPINNWALVTPRIAGRPPGSDSEFVRLMTTGISRTGSPPKPPMPNFGMTRSDAESVLAYLKSLTP
jgi:mono/diheme cytochrome c family protein